MTAFKHFLPVYLTSLWISLVFGLPNYSIAQMAATGPATDWPSIEAGASRSEFRELEKFLKPSYQWETNERIAYLNKAVDAALQLDNDSLIFFYAEKLGVLYREIDSTVAAISNLNLALAHSYDPSSKGIAYNSLGALHRKSGDYNTALDYYFKSLAEGEKLQNGTEAYSIGNISEIYFYLNDFENAIKYLKYSISFSAKLPDPEKAYSLVYDYSYLIDCFLAMDRLDSAAYYLDTALLYLQSIDTIRQQKFQDAGFVGYFSVADYYLKAGKPEEAAVYIDKAEEKAQEFYLSSIVLLQARLEILRQNFRAALATLDNDALKHLDFSTKEDILQLKAEAYTGLREFEKVIDIKEQLLAHQEQKFADDRSKYVTFADARYETLRKDDEIKALKLDQQVKSLTIQNQRFLVLITVLLILVFAITAFVLWRRFQRRKQLSAQLQKEVDLKTEHLRQKNEELRILTYVASHDIKEPIRNIGNFVGLIDRKIPDEAKPEVSHFFEYIKKSIRQIYTLTEDIAGFITSSNTEGMKTSKVDLDLLVDDLSSALQPFLEEKNAQLINNGLPTLQTNATAMYTILKNLIENGIKFNRAKVPMVEISHNTTATHHQIIVADNGIGIEAAYHEKIFESFERLNYRDDFDGSGIGLAVVQMMARKLNGQVEVHSNPGAGSRFILSVGR